MVTVAGFTKMICTGRTDIRIWTGNSCSPALSVDTSVDFHTASLREYPHPRAQLVIGAGTRRDVAHVERDLQVIIRMFGLVCTGKEMTDG